MSDMSKHQNSMHQIGEEATHGNERDIRDEDEPELDIWLGPGDRSGAAMEFQLHLEAAYDAALTRFEKLFEELDRLNESSESSATSAADEDEGLDSIKQRAAISYTWLGNLDRLDTLFEQLDDLSPDKPPRYADQELMGQLERYLAAAAEPTDIEQLRKMILSQEQQIRNLDERCTYLSSRIEQQNLTIEQQGQTLDQIVEEAVHQQQMREAQRQAEATMDANC